MAKLASVLIGLGVVGAAGIFFAIGLFAGSGEDYDVYWSIRATFWGFAAVTLILGAVAIWLALRSEKR